jgi:hypothetical protein
VNKLVYDAIRAGVHRHVWWYGRNVKICIDCGLGESTSVTESNTKRGET